MHRAIIVAMLSTLLMACGIKPRPPAESALVQRGYAAMDQWLDAAVKKSKRRAGITGLSVAVTDVDGVVLQRHYGFADKASAVPVANETRFRAGSVSKPFTSIAVHQLAEQALLDLDAPLQTIIPGFSIRSRHGGVDQITLRNILSHHAGLPSDILDGMWSDEPAAIADVVDMLQSSYTTSAPGTVMAYSNIGFTLAGVAIEQVSGQSFEKYMQLSVLDALGMSSSSFNALADHPQLSHSYINGKPVDEAGIRDTPAGALVSTTDDLAKMVVAVLNNGRIANTSQALLQPKTVKDMLTAQTYASPYAFANMAALGWIRVPSLLPRGHDLVWHNGQTLGHSALVHTSLEAGLGIVMLSNSPATEAMDALAKDIMQHAYTIRYGGEQAKRPVTESDPLPGTAASAEGQYISTAGLATVTRRGGHYAAEFSGQKWRLDEAAPGQYKAKLRLFGLIPVANDTLRSATVHVRSLGAEHANEKLIFVESEGIRQFLASSVSPQSPSSVWLSRAGEYELITQLHDSKFLDIGSVKLEQQDGVHVAVLTMDDQVAAYPLSFHSDNEASLQGYGRMLGAALQFTEEGIFEVMGLRFRRVVD